HSGHAMYIELLKNICLRELNNMLHFKFKKSSSICCHVQLTPSDL
uniref:Uncharacterized protein n=1 Tax=Monopterus albus TaxID=43700 RepID=A0A3Q3IZX0_MONAL